MPLVAKRTVHSSVTFIHNTFTKSKFGLTPSPSALRFKQCTQVSIPAVHSHTCSKITFRANSDESPHEEPVASRVGKPQAAAPQRSARRSSEAMWKGSGRTLFQTVIMENFKFTLFVVTPIVTSSLFWNDAIVTYIVKSRKYVTYPPEGERPPTNQRELEERIAEQRRARSKEGSPST